MVDSHSDLMTVTEVAQRLRVTPNTVRTMISRRELRAVKIGKQWRVHAISVERIVEEGSDDVRDGTDANAGAEARPPSIADGRKTGSQGHDQKAGGDRRTAGGRDHKAKKRAPVKLRHGTG